MKGSQFLFWNDYKENNLEFDKVLRLKEQDLNNIYSSKTKLAQYGYQKFLTSKTSHDDYFLVVSSHLLRKIFLHGNLENEESAFIL